MDIIFADIFIVISLLTLLAALLLVICSVWHSLKVDDSYCSAGTAYRGIRKYVSYNSTHNAPRSNRGIAL